MSQSNKRADYRQRPMQSRPEACRRPQGQPQGYRRAPQRSPQTRGSGAPSSPIRLSRVFPRGLWKLLILGLFAVAAAYFLQCAWPNGFPLVKRDAADVRNVPEKITEIHSAGPIRINEIMTANGSSMSTADGSMPDWIEIANVSRSSVELKGWKLAKSADSVNVFAFPEQTLAPNECVVIFADSKLRDTAGEEYHAPFRLSSGGDTLMLFNDSGAAVDTVNIPALLRDHSYVRTDTKHWSESRYPTPCLENTAENYRLLTEKSDSSPVILTELMASNKSAFADADGQYYDYIELYNRSDSAVDLNGWYLSDDRGQVRKWRFPEITIGAGETLVVFASGLDRRDDPAALHTNFSLSSEGESVVLASEKGQVMDVVDYDLLKRNVAMQLQSDGSWSLSAEATPGSR